MNLMHVQQLALKLATNVSPVSKSAACAVNPLWPLDSFCKTITDIVKMGYNFAPNSSLGMIYSRLYTNLNSKPPI